MTCGGPRKLFFSNRLNTSITLKARLVTSGVAEAGEGGLAVGRGFRFRLRLTPGKRRGSKRAKGLRGLTGGDICTA